MSIGIVCHSGYSLTLCEVVSAFCTLQLSATSFYQLNILLHLSS